MEKEKTNDKMLETFQEAIKKMTRGVTMSEFDDLKTSLFDAVKVLKTNLDSVLQGSTTSVDKKLTDFSSTLGKIESKLKDLVNSSENNTFAQIQSLSKTLSDKISEVKVELSKKSPELQNVLQTVAVFKEAIINVTKLIKDNEATFSQELKTVEAQIPAEETGESLVGKLQTVHRPWLSIEAIEGDFNSKVTKQFGGGNTTPLEVQVNGVSYGGARIVNFIGSGVAAEIINGIVTVTVAGGGNAMVDNETVSGSGTSFTLSQTPVTGTVHLYALGQRLKPTTDFSISGVDIITVSSWSAGDLTADYQI